MHSIRKRVTGLVMVLAVALTFGTAAAPAQEAQAASKSKYMKKLGLNWDLKEGKKVSMTEVFAAVRERPLEAEITKLKISDAKRKGYKKLTFVVTFTHLFAPTSSEVDEMVNTPYCKETGSIGGGYLYAVVDYDTGLDLEGDNDFGVTCKSSGFKYFNDKTYYGSNGNWASFSRTVKAKVSIAYPEDYKGLCIGVGGNTQLTEAKADARFWEGKAPFGNTSFYKKGKKNSHWMRVSNIK